MATLQRIWAMPTKKWRDRFFLTGLAVPVDLAFRTSDGSSPSQEVVSREMRLPADVRSIKTRLFTEPELEKIEGFRVIIIR